METDYRVSRFDGALRLLPVRLREQIRKIPKEKRGMTEEIRLRAGRNPTVLVNGHEEVFSDEKVTSADLGILLDITARASAHTVRDRLQNGFITVRGGYRVGFGGSMIVRDGHVDGYRAVSSASIRISREERGVSDELCGSIYGSSGVVSTLILSPPGGGKTTLLRDMIRSLSYDGHRISVIDERGEIAAMFEGVPQFDVGPYTDILEGCPKDFGIITAVRALNPQIIAVDEITDEKDVHAMIGASYCGVKFLAAAHAENETELTERPVYKSLLDAGIFKVFIYIGREGSKRIYRTGKTVSTHD